MPTKRIRSDSHKTEGEMLRSKPPEVPAHIHLPDDARPSWDSIVRAREYNAWTQVDLEHVANLAICLSDLDRLRQEVRIEGDVIENARGTPVVNPKHQLMETLSRRSVALSRMLHVHAEATAGDSRDDKTRNAKQRELSAQREALDDGDGLIAAPMH